MFSVILIPVMSQATVLPEKRATFDSPIENKRITVKMTDVPVGRILDEIKAQSGANFVVNSQIIAKLGRRSLNVTNVTLPEAIAALLNGVDYDFTITGNNVSFVPSLFDPAQTSLYSGKVTNRKGEPLAGVTVMVKDSFYGTATDRQGEFSLRAAKGQILCFSLVGMNSCEVMCDSPQKKLKVTMVETTRKMDQVVITGMFRKGAQTFTGSAVTISSEELEQFSSRNLIATLRNIDPSFDIIDDNISGSDPNKLPEVQIRGSSSIPKVTELQDNTKTELNTPLIILDGFESSLQVLFDMNENEIASVTLLKDAAATALYGSRGANGVIIITSKMPEKGNLKISYGGSLDLEIPDLTSYDLLNAREKLELEKLVGKFKGSSNDGFYAFEQYYNYLLARVNDGVDTYWMAKPLRIGVGQSHNIRAEGGNEAFRYSASAQYSDTKGVMKKSERSNINASVNLAYIMDKIRFSYNIIINEGNSAASPYGSFATYARMNPYFSPYDEAGNLVKTLGVDGENSSLRWGREGVANPLWDASLNTYNKTNNSAVTNNFSIEWTPVEGLTMRGMLGISRTVAGVDQFNPPDLTIYDNYSQNDMLRKGEYLYQTSKAFKIDATLNMSYFRTFSDKHHIYGGVNANLRQDESSSVGFEVEGFVNGSFDFPGAALQYAQGTVPQGVESKSRAVGITTNANYSYDNRYFADFTLSLDGNSAFGKSNPFGTFWSAGAGWNIHNEAFIDESGFINKLKIRGSVGSTGSQSFNSYQALTTYNYYLSQRYYAWGGAMINRLGNPDLKWQQTMKYNVGFESEFMHRRLQLNVDLYREITYNQISTIEIPASTGFSSYVANFGEVENRGVEVKLSTVIIQSKANDLRWSLNISAIHNDNVINKLSPLFKSVQSSIEAMNTDANPLRIYKEGYTMNAIWVVPSLGIDPSTGRELYLDRNGNPTWEWSQADIAKCGIAQPRVQGNVNTILRWRNFNFSASFGYRLGGQIYNQTLISKVEDVDYDYNVDSRIFTSRWKNPGDKTMFKSIYLTEQTRKSSRFVQDEYTLNCQAMSLSYDLPQRLLKMLNVSNLTLRASTNDLFYISSVKRERGIDYPFSYRMLLSINVIF